MIYFDYQYFYEWNTLHYLRRRNIVYYNLTRVREWLLLNATSAIFSTISRREQVNFQWDDDEIRFVLDEHAELNLYSASSLKKDMSLHWTHYSDSEPTSLAFPLMLSA